MVAVTPTELVGLLTLRSIEWQNVYAFEEGKPLWTEEQLRCVYDEKTLELWKKQDVCPIHGVIRRNGKCGFSHELTLIATPTPQNEQREKERL